MDGWMDGWVRPCGRVINCYGSRLRH